MTLEELSRYDGKDGRPAYVGYNGSVYDVSSSDMWKDGEHVGGHMAGLDLTDAMADAPHGDGVFKKFKVVGKLELGESGTASNEQNSYENKIATKKPQLKQTIAKEQISSKEKWREWYQIYHPHPMMAHFPIVLHFFAAAMDVAFFFSPVEKFEQAAYYAFFSATLLGLLAMITGTLSWWVNYNFNMIRPLVIKLYVSILTLILGCMGIYLHIIDPMVAYKSTSASFFYHFSILITVPAVVVLGYYGGKLSWNRKRKRVVGAKEEIEQESLKPESLAKKDFTILIGGSAGSGISMMETLLIDAFASMGYFVFSTKEYMSRVRGGSNSVEIRISNKTVKSAKWEPDLFLGFDDLSISHVKDRIGFNTFVIGGQNEKFSKHLQISLTEEAKKHVTKQFVNTFSAGLLFGILKLPKEFLENALKKRFSEKDNEENIKALTEGYIFAQSQNIELEKLPEVLGSSDKTIRYLDGTTAAGFGFLAGGCNSVTSYPMSPSTGVLNFFAGLSQEFDIVVEQAEDEIAAFNMVLGSWYAGGRALTTTSGGGFALMSEGMSLSGITETPAVVYLAQRPGPATGLPTRTEQGDLNLVLYAGHGEFPRLILAPGDLEEAIELGHLAFEMADRFQVPVVYLSDQYFADTVQSVSNMDFESFSQNRHISKSEEDYLRYKFSDDGISERAVPGYGDGLVRYDSHEHDEKGQTTESYKIRDRMVSKRKSKLHGLTEVSIAPQIIGNGDIAVVGWGSTKGVISDAIFSIDNPSLVQVHFSWIYPLKKEDLLRLSKMKTIIVVENNSNAQFADLLKLHDIRVDASILQSDGFAFFGDKLVEALVQKVKDLS